MTLLPRCSHNAIILPCRLSAYWLGASPATFYKLYTWQAVVLFSCRLVVYRMKKWHYYLFDL